MKTTIILFFLLAFLSSCEDEPIPCCPSDDLYQEGIFITNEGPFQIGSGTISFYDPIAERLEETIFQQANPGALIGNVLQSMTFWDDHVYLVINNSDAILQVHDPDFESMHMISGFNLPRYLLAATDELAYVSQWGSNGLDGGIQVMNLRTRELLEAIPTGSGAERMIRYEGKVYIVNEGGFGRDSILSVIDIETHTIIKEIVVGNNPNSILLDSSEKIWTIGRGHTENWLDPGDPANLSGLLCRVENDEVSLAIDIPLGASNLVASSKDDWLFFTTENGIWRFKTDGTMLEPAFWFPGIYYELAWDHKRDLLLASDAGDFINPGRIDEINMDGSIIGSFDAGIIPGGIYVR